MTRDPALRPDVRAFLEAMAAAPRPIFTAQLLASIRTMPMDAMAMLDLPIGDVAIMQDVVMPGPGGDIALRLFDARAERGPGPALVFFHGGGFVVGGIDTHAAMAAEIARRLDVAVISVEYRLAPEHPWPAAPDDAEAAARWIAANGATFGRVFTGLILCGDSAGGNLALVSMLALRDRPAPLPVIMQLLLYPGTDQRRDYESARGFADGYGLEAVNMRLYDEHYAADPLHWRASPLLGDLAGTPPTLLVTAQFDPLRDEGRAYAARAVLAGVRTRYLELAGTIHGFASYRRMIGSARNDLTLVLDNAVQLLAEIQGGG